MDRIYDWLHYRQQDYDEIIIDEAQDVSQESHEQLKNRAGSICYGADDQQMIYPDHASTQQQLLALYAENLSCPLDENFRNSYEIMIFVKSLFPDKHISQNTLRGLKADENRRSNKPRVINIRGLPDREREVR